MSSLGDKILAIHSALAGADVTHAFGGAIALAYCVGEPRATIDVDLNVFVEPSSGRRTLELLPGVTWTDADLATIERDGQRRLWWDNTPVDLFFAYDPFHWSAQARVREVPFEGSTIPVLDCTDLAVFKAFFARGKDFVDIEAMARAKSLDRRRLRAVIKDLLGADSANYERVAAALEEADRPTF
jgi:hypothetical protein